MLRNNGGVLVPALAGQQVTVVPGIIGFAVVEFFGAILVTDVAPVAGADGVVAMARRKAGRKVTCRTRRQMMPGATIARPWAMSESRQL